VDIISLHVFSNLLVGFTLRIDLIMSWLFNKMLKKYSRGEAGRMHIHQVLQEQVRQEYREQTVPGNVYNNQIEVIMSNEVIQKAVERGNTEYLAMVKKGVDNAFDIATKFIENEKMFPTEYE
jgi:hypothetical protein